LLMFGLTPGKLFNDEDTAAPLRQPAQRGKWHSEIRGLTPGKFFNDEEAARLSDREGRDALRISEY